MLIQTNAVLGIMQLVPKLLGGGTYIRALLSTLDVP